MLSTRRPHWTRFAFVVLFVGYMLTTPWESYPGAAAWGAALANATTAIILTAILYYAVAGGKRLVAWASPS